jgi:alkylation response protein AidB-like acyl-CoA dehydrogenase
VTAPPQEPDGGAAVHDVDDGYAALRAVLSTAGARASSRADEEVIRAGREYLGALADGGWFVPTWPAGTGGRGSGKSEAARIRSIVRGYPAPDLYPFFVGLHMIGPTLLQHGEQAQQERWLRRIADGSDIWCQMFSEPGAGSDLANVSTRAVRTEAGWSLDGQKVWTSRGSYATFGLCLARTDPDVPKHAGLTMFVVPMKAPGVTVRPLHQMNGDDHFSEVFLDGVEIGDDLRVGEVGEGWKIALTVLAFERSSIAVAVSASGPKRRQGNRRVPEWLQAAADAGQLDDPVRRDEAVAVFVAAEAARLTSARAAARAKSTGAPGAEGSGQKLRLANLAKQRAYLIKDLQGAEGMLTSHRGHDAAMTAPSLSLRGGTDEIQRNIIAERVLGLPAEPRSDRDIPWSASKRGAV